MKIVVLSRDVFGINCIFFTIFSTVFLSVNDNQQAMPVEIDNTSIPKSVIDDVTEMQVVALKQQYQCYLI